MMNFLVTSKEEFESKAYIQGENLNNISSENRGLDPEIQLEVNEYNLDTLVSEIVEFERTHGLSSIQLLTQYVRGELGHADEYEDWLGLIFLYLGTQEVRRFSCP